MSAEQNFTASSKKVLMLGCFDTKAEDFHYLYTRLVENGLEVITLNTGVRGSTKTFPVNIEVDEVAQHTGVDLAVLQATTDRGVVVEKMGLGAAKIITKLVANQQIDGAIGMGGGGGTYIALAAMQAIPLGIPKLCLSTVATKDLSRQVGAKDITLMPSIVDIAGLNSISRLMINQAAAAISGMVNAKRTDQQEKKGSIAISMFGNTTACVNKCTELLKSKGYEVMAFHAVGSGGKTMEALIREGCFDGVLDITITELADNLCDGICTAGPNRLTAATEMGIPQVVAPGCIDMVNFGHLDTVPARFKDRLLYSWAPDVTLMRTNEQENRVLGQEIAQKLNQAKGKVVILLPLKGISIVSSEGGIFHDSTVDQTLFDTIKVNTIESIPVREIKTDINDNVFAETAVNTLLELIQDN